MNYPLIITGAGASYDFLVRNEYPQTDNDLDSWIPPLTNELFKREFQPILDKYPEMDELVGYIKSKLRNNQNQTFELILSKLFNEKATKNNDLFKSFMALLFYLSDLFNKISNIYYRRGNNYHALIEIIKHTSGKAVFINYNYDLLLEKSLGKTDIKHIDHYISEPFPIIKAHGAYNWYWQRLVNAWGEEKKTSYEISVNYSKPLFDTNQDRSKWGLSILKDLDNPNRLSSIKVSTLSAYSSHPAIALPIVNKNSYICPVGHINFLKNKIKEIDRILIIGWRMVDPFLINLLLDELNLRKIPIAYIGGKDLKSHINSLNKTIKESIVLINKKGFSDFLSSDEDENFLT